MRSILKPVRRAFATTILVAILAAGSTAGAVAVAVTTCGQTVSGVGQLIANLDCTGSSEPGVRLQDASILDLAGHTLSGGNGDGVSCEGRCAVTSTKDAGMVTGFAGDGIVSRSATFEDGQVRVDDLTVADNGGYGIRVDMPAGSVAVRHSTVSDNGAIGVYSPGRLRVATTTVSGNASVGVFGGGQVDVLRSLVTLNGGVGISAGDALKLVYTDVLDNLDDGVRAAVTMTTRRVHILGNGGSGIVLSSLSRRARIYFVEVSDNALDGIRVEGEQTGLLRLKIAFVDRNGRHGVVSRNVGIYQSRVEDNGFHGVFAGAGGGSCLVRLSEYTFLGNGSDPSCGASMACADVASCAAPLAITASTQCGTSYDTSSGFPGTSWGICAND